MPTRQLQPESGRHLNVILSFLACILAPQLSACKQDAGIYISSVERKLRKHTVPDHEAKRQAYRSGIAKIGRDGPIGGRGISLSKDGRRLYLGAVSGDVLLYDTALLSHKQFWTAPGEINSIQLACEDSMLVVEHGNRRQTFDSSSVTVISTKNGKHSSHWATASTGMSDVVCSRDCWCAYRSTSDLITIRDLRLGIDTKTLGVESPGRIAIFEAQRILAVVRYAYSVELFETGTFRKIGEFDLQRHLTAISGMALVENGARLIAAGVFKVADINLRSGAIRTIYTHKWGVSAVAGLTSANLYAVSFSDGALRICIDIPQGGCRQYNTGKDEVMAMVFTQDGILLTYGFQSGEVVKWDPRSGRVQVQ